MRSYVVLIIIAILLLAVPAYGAQETFSVQWAQYDTYDQPKWSDAVTLLTLEPYVFPDESGSGYHLYGPSGNTTVPAFDFYFRCTFTNPEECTIATNFSVPFDGTMSILRNYASQGDATMELDITWSGHTTGRLIGVGHKVVASPLRVFITNPNPGATVSGTAWITLWVEGTSGTSNVFTLRVDGKQVGAVKTSSRGPVTIPWTTSSVPNGTHSVSATVTDATGNSGTSSQSVIVKN